eukprot:m.8318 g.8318  ORF g.8318 m.8318 type:complete len:121 (-) comp9144_c0_seq1:54-416(-)
MSATTAIASSSHPEARKVGGVRRSLPRAAKRNPQAVQDPATSDLLAEPTSSELQARKEATMATSAKELAKRHKHDPMNAKGVVKPVKLQVGKRYPQGKPAKAHNQMTNHQHMSRATGAEK